MRSLSDADDRLHEQSGQRRREPEHRHLVRLRAELLVDGAHVRHLQPPAELDAEEPEAHIPDLPERETGRFIALIPNSVDG